MNCFKKEVKDRNPEQVGSHRVRKPARAQRSAALKTQRAMGGGVPTDRNPEAARQTENIEIVQTNVIQWILQG